MSVASMISVPKMAAAARVNAHLMGATVCPDCNGECGKLVVESPGTMFRQLVWRACGSCEYGFVPSTVRKGPPPPEGEECLGR